MVEGYVLLREVEDKDGNFKVIIPLVVSDSHPEFHTPKNTEEFIKKSQVLFSYFEISFGYANKRDGTNPIDIALLVDNIATDLSQMIKQCPDASEDELKIFALKTMIKFS